MFWGGYEEEFKRWKINALIALLFPIRIEPQIEANVWPFVPPGQDNSTMLKGESL
tara:strand:- start:753 stop:917 length:165 start_codon:yes stop_codon:yes gene_type:complete